MSLSELVYDQLTWQEQIMRPYKFFDGNLTLRRRVWYPKGMMYGSDLSFFLFYIGLCIQIKC